MRLDETKVFLFTFTTDAGDISIPVRAQSKEEAGDKMQRMLSRIQTELAMEFPKVAPAPEQPIQEALQARIPTEIPAEVLELRIDTLLADMGAAELRGKAKGDTIKNWTGYPFEPENYTNIITELELIKTGVKEVPVKKK